MPGLGVREARLVKRDLWNKIQDCHKQLLEFSSKNEVLLFEEDELKKLDWVVPDFSKNMQDITTGGGPPDTSGERLFSEFEKLVVACKTRINELTSTNVESTFCLPNMQLWFSSKFGKSGQSGTTMALAEEIIDEELELEMLQADAEAYTRAAEAKAEADRRTANAEAEKMAASARFDAGIRKKQAILQAEKWKQELSSRSLTASLVRSSRHSRSHAKEVLPQPPLRPRATEQGAPSFKIVGSGKSSGAAVGSGPLHN